MAAGPDEHGRGGTKKPAALARAGFVVCRIESRRGVTQGLLGGCCGLMRKRSFQSQAEAAVVNRGFRDRWGDGMLERDRVLECIVMGHSFVK